METVDLLKRRVDTAQELHSLVRTMKAMAAVNIRHLERAVESLDDYQRTIELALRAVLRQSDRTTVTSRVATKQKHGWIVIGSDQGMCGPLNDQIVNTVRDLLQTYDSPNHDHAWMSVGVRAAGRMEDAGMLPETVLPIASSTSGITPLVQEILLHIDRWHADRGVDHVIVVYAKHLSQSSYIPAHFDLLPIDRNWLDRLQSEPWPTRGLPYFTMDAQALFSTLVRQYLFVSLFRTCGESMASENASRLMAMRGAERNIGQRIQELTLQFHQVRQMAITEELLDIASGFEALSQSELGDEQNDKMSEV